MPDLAVVEGATPPPVATLSIDDLKLEAVNLKLAIDKGENVMREWRLRLGEVLTELQDRLDHGEWLPYVEQHLTFGKRQAQDYQLLARNARRVALLPSGLSMREELRLLRRPTVPRPVPETNGEVNVTPLERYMVGATSAQVVTSIVHTLFPSAKRVLDPTYGLGQFHDGTLGLTVTAHDDLEERAPDGRMDVTDLQYGDAVFDIVLFDPPHLADGGEDSIMAERFGTMTQEQIDNLIINGTRECWRVCNIAIIVKVTDHVHGQVFQEESALVGEALDWPTPYEKVHQVRMKGLVDPRWEAEHDRYSAFNNGSTYLVFKKGSQIHGGS